MGNLKYKLQQWMYGRNGNDQLNHFLLVIALIFMVISMFAPTKIFYYVTLVLIVLVYFRMFSKNLYRRQAENSKYLELTAGIRGIFSRNRSHAQDKAHRYFKCPNCRQTVRVPRGRGKIEITCPKCRTQFIKRS